MTRRSGLVVLFLVGGGCTGGPALEPAGAAVTQKTSALSGVGVGPLVLGATFNGIFLETTEASNPFSASSIGQFSPGDAIAATDVGANGNVEIAHGAVDAFSGGGTVLITDQTGTLISGGIQGVAPYAPGGAVGLGDINGDGVADVISTTATSDPIFGISYQVTVNMANGAQSPPESAIEQLTFRSGGGMVVCDFDGDGVDDIIVAPLFTMYSGKTGTISAIPGAAGHFNDGNKLACGDLNGDGFEDLIIGAPTGSGLGLGDFEVISAPGAPSGAPTSFFTGVNDGIPLSPGDDIAAGDLDGDGVAEFVVAHQFQPGGVVNVYSAPGKTPLSFGPSEGFGDGAKVAVPKHTQPIKITVTNITIPYIVAYILYVPPGDKSVTDNIAGTTLGSSETITVSTTEGQSVDLKLTAKDPMTGQKVASADGKVNVTYTNSTITTNSVSTTETTEIMNPQQPGQDQPDHSYDNYVINFNVPATVTDAHNGQPPTIDMDMTQGTLIDGVAALFLSEIANSQTVTIDPSPERDIILGAIDTPEKAKELLKLDPFFTPSFTNDVITQNPTRFVPFITDLTGSNVVSLPHPLGTNQDGGVIQVGPTKYTGSRSSTTGQGTGTGTTVTYNGTIDLLDTLGLGQSYSTTYSIVDSTTKTTTTGDSITLGTDHRCVRGNISLYQDVMYGGSFLTLQDTLLDAACQAAIDAMSFEALADWQVQDGGSATLSSTSVSGASSLSVSAAPGGWTPIVSIPLSSSVLREAATSSDLSKVSFALNIPTTQPNPYWVGDAQMFISSPNANVFNQPLGEVNLTGLPEGQFNRIEFTVPSNALPALTQDNPDVTFTIVLNINAGTSGWLVDDLQIGS